MTKDTIKKSDKDYFLFLEAGFVAVNKADEDSALKLFMACESLRPDNIFPKVGYGYMHMCKLELKLAEAMFMTILDKDPTNEMAEAFLGICRSMMPGKTPDGEKALIGLTKKSSSPEIKDLVKRSHEFIDEFVKKKTTSPMSLAKNEPKKKKN